MSKSAAAPREKKRLSLFERYLTLWVALCIVAGTLIGNWWPKTATWLSQFTYAQISIPVAVLI
ncbi:MAG TPA: arsenical-resistance protein, partial [Coriobacteriia bacterium]